MMIDELASALHGIGYRWGTAAADHVIGSALRGIATLDARKAAWFGPGRYVGWHRDLSLIERVRDSWRVRRAARAQEHAQRARLAASVAWWERRRLDYAPAYARVAARAGAAA